MQGLRWLIAGGEGLYYDFDALLLCIQHPFPDRGQEVDEYDTQWVALEDAIGGIEKMGCVCVICTFRGGSLCSVGLDASFGSGLLRPLCDVVSLPSAESEPLYFAG